jgi:fluoride ion exporter CrcB/FEX
LRLGQESATGLALINVLVSVAAGIAAAWLGTVLGRLV